MVVDEQARVETVTPLPHLMLHSMTQSQLKDFIPQLVTQVTGRTSPLFGSLPDKPDWWPCDLEWTSPEELTHKYQDPCKKLREIVQSCYCFMDQDNLLNSSDLAEFTSDLPVSPAVGDADLSASSPDTEPGSSKQVKPENIGQTREEDETVDEVDSGLTDQGKTECSEDTEKSSKGVGQMKKPVDDTVTPSGCISLDSDCQTEYAEINDDMENCALADAGKNEEVEDCEDTGMSGDTADSETENISADVIAQIDFEIAKSLKAAFSKMGNMGFSNVGEIKGESCGIDPLFGVDMNVQTKEVNKRRKSAEDLQQRTDTTRSFPETSKLLERTPASKNQKTERKDKVFSELVQMLEKPVSLLVNNKHGKTRDTGKPGIKESIGGAQTECNLKEEILDIAKRENKEEKHEDEVVWICFVCAKGFADQSELMKHQDVCEDEPENVDLDPLKSSHSVSSSLKDQSMTNKSSSNDCLSRNPNSQPVPALLRKVGSNIKSLPLGLPSKSRVIRKRQRKLEDIYIPPSRDVYFECLGLFPTPCVEAISKSPRKSVTEDDCQIIDLTMEDPQAVPMTPRTRTMLSQLSRDDSSGRRRQLSFSHSSTPSVPDKQEVDFKEMSDNSETSDEEDTIQKHKIPSKTAILGIPLTSPLGQRLKKHWNYENKVPVIENIEIFCKTDTNSLLNLNKNKTKNPMVDKLRNRPPPQCTFRFTKKYLNKWCHLFKFNKADKREFDKRLKTGLDRDSRIKLRRMKKCQVVLARISKKDIKYWTTPRAKVVPKRFLQDSLMLQQSSRQYRLNQIQNTMVSNTMRPMQGSFYNQFPQPARFNTPTPQLLVRTVPMGVQELRLQVLPIQQTQNQNLFLSTHNNLAPAAPQEVGRSQKRKQVFSNLREDDNMVICLSSDEEEEIVIKPMSKQHTCTMCSIYKDNCRIHGKRRIGPASFMRQHSSNQEPASSPKVDLKPCVPASVITRTPINPVQPVQYPNTASARIFGSSIRPFPQNSPMSGQPKPNFTHMRISGGTAAVISRDSWSVPAHKDASQTIHSGNETGSVDNFKTDTQSGDSEYMDYEVICIDSDDE